MIWWMWLAAVLVALLVLAGAVLGVQAKRRGGGAIVVRRGRRAGRGGIR